MKIESYTELITNTENIIILDIKRKDKDIENISFTTLPKFFTTFEVYIGGQCVFHIDCEDFDKYLNQVKIALTKIPDQIVRFHFIYDPIDEVNINYLSIEVNTPDIDITLVDGIVDGTELDYFEYEHKVVKIFNPNIDYGIKFMKTVKPIDGTPIEVAMAGKTPFKAEYTNYLRYCLGIAGLWYNLYNL